MNDSTLDMFSDKADEEQRAEEIEWAKEFDAYWENCLQYAESVGISASYMEAEFMLDGTLVEVPVEKLLGES